MLPSAVLAEPKPTPQELKTKLDRLSQQAEVITEQYNGRRLDLTRAQRAKKRVEASLARTEQDYQRLHLSAVAMASTTYMTGGLDSASFFMGGDPQAALSNAAHISQISGERALVLGDLQNVRTRLTGERSRLAEQADKIADAVADLAEKKKRITKLVDEVEANLLRQTGQRDPVRLLPLSIEGKGKAADAAKWAISQAGKPYRWGAAGPDSFDCSGLMLWAYAKVGISLPHYTGAQWQLGRRVPRDQLQVGDILFFYSDLHHNGMYIGNNQMVHAPRTGDVVRIVDIRTRPYMGAVRLVS